MVLYTQKVAVERSKGDSSVAQVLEMELGVAAVMV